MSQKIQFKIFFILSLFFIQGKNLYTTNLNNNLEQEITQKDILNSPFSLENIEVT